MNKIIIVIGETGSGKTKWVEKFLDESSDPKKIAVINTDSMQMYDEISVGNNKENLNDDSTFSKHRVKTHLFSIFPPTKDFSVSEVQKLARDAIRECWQNQVTPILVGGSGLYLASIIYDYKLNYENDWTLLQTENTQQLQQDLINKGFDLDRLNNSDRNNPRRLVNYLRKIESGIDLEEIYPSSNSTKFDFYYDKKQLELINLTNNHSLSELESKLLERSREMLANGLILEVQLLKKRYGENIAKTIKNSTGYKQVFEYLDKNSDINLFDDLAEDITKSHLKLVKKQRKWNKKYFSL